MNPKTAQAAGTTGTTVPAANQSKKFIPTPEQIAEWKHKHSDVFAYETEDGRYACYLKRPSRQVVDLASTKSQGSNFKMADVILDNCWLDGNHELRTVDRYYIGLQRQIGEIIDVAAGELKKL